MSNLFLIWRLGRFVLKNRDRLINELLLARIGTRTVTWHSPDSSPLSALFELLSRIDVRS